MRKNISSGTKWESAVGYSRAVRIGPHVWVAGTTAVDERGEVLGEGDAHAQAEFVFAKIGRALKEAGADFRHVVRSRMYIVNLGDQDGVGRAHAAVLAGVRPAATMVQISGLVDPRLLIEIEVEAYITE